MLRSEAVAIVKQVLGYRTNLDATIESNMRLQQTKLELMPTKPWFLLSEISYKVTVAEEPRVPLPLNFLDEYEEGCLWYMPDDTTKPDVPLTKDGYDVLVKNYLEEVPGPPEAYALTGNYFRLFPLPDSTYTIKMLYYKRDAILASDTENQWLKWVPELLIGKTGALTAASLRDFEAVKIFDRMTQESMMLLENQNEARKHSNYDMQIGGKH